MQTYFLHLTGEEFKKLSPVTETEEDWKDCEIPADYYQQSQPQEEKKLEEDPPKTLAMTADIMSPKLQNAEESGYIGGGSGQDHR